MADPNLKNSINPKIQIKEKALTTDENWRMKKAIELADKQLNKKIRKTSKSITTGWTTLDQGNNRLGDNIIKKRYVDEGIAGTREENKGMRTNQSRDMLKRNKGIS